MTLVFSEREATELVSSTRWLKVRFTIATVRQNRSETDFVDINDKIYYFDLKRKRSRTIKIKKMKNRHFNTGHWLFCADARISFIQRSPLLSGRVSFWISKP